SIDPPKVLVDGLTTLDSNKTDLVYAMPATNYHSYTVCIVRPKRVRDALYRALVEHFSVRLKLYRKFGVVFDVGPLSGLFSTLYTKIKEFRLTGSFSVFSSNYVDRMKGKVFDEVYINSVEDVDLCLRLVESSANLATVNYKIGDYVGGTIGGFSHIRTLREIANWAYFNYKITTGALKTANNAHL
ncbi:MAG: hypothetical protein QW514_09930, partial [Thermoprotei archaeon]